MTWHRAGSLERAVLYDVRQDAANDNLKDAVAAADGKVRGWLSGSAGCAGGPLGQPVGQRARRAVSKRAWAGTAPRDARWMDRLKPDLTRSQIRPRIA
jgi:hypothetical protein